MMTREGKISCLTCCKNPIPLPRNKQTKEMINRGCYEDSPRPQWRDEKGQWIKRCPIRLIDQEAETYLTFYIHYKNGYLPFSGGILQQPEKIMRAFSYIEYLEYKTMEEKAKKPSLTGNRGR